MLSEKTLWGFGEYFASYHSNIMFCLLFTVGLPQVCVGIRELT